MKVSGIEVYNNTYINKTDDTSELYNLLNKGSKAEEKQGSNGIKLDLNNPDDIITKKERDFFIQLFPENSEQLSKHVLFNRNGKLQTHNLSKGLIVDGRA